MDPTGRPLADAETTLRAAATRTAVTDADGRFDFQGLPEGEYELAVSLPGFSPVRRTVRLGPGAQSVVTVTLTLRLLEQAVVTASRPGETDPQAMPMAVTVLSGSRPATDAGSNYRRHRSRAPGVSFSQNTGLAQLTIRGIGTNAVFAGSDPSSAVYLDGVYLARPAMVLADFLDLDRIEVLRGPQGTLYGRNSLGGAINLFTQTAYRRIRGGRPSDRRKSGHVRRRRASAGRSCAARLMGSAVDPRGVRDGAVRDLEHPDHPLGGEDVSASVVSFARSSTRAASCTLAGDFDPQRSGSCLLFENPGGQAGISGRRPRRGSMTCAPRFPRRAAPASPERRHA